MLWLLHAVLLVETLGGPFCDDRRWSFPRQSYILDDVHLNLICICPVKIVELIPRDQLTIKLTKVGLSEDDLCHTSAVFNDHAIATKHAASFSAK